MRRAKIIATIGPASSSVETLENLIRKGMDIARLNMGHGDHEQQKNLIANIRQASRQVGREVAILMDLCGPKIRVGRLDKSLKLQAGAEWFIGSAPEKKKNFIPTEYENLVSDCRDGARVLFDDGTIEARAISREGKLYKIVIETGGELKSRKGINLPEIRISAPSFTRADREDVMFGLKNGIDIFALSFVREGNDVEELKFLLHKLKKRTPVVAKIENTLALENLDSILAAADAIMVARGDLGVELGNPGVPSAQKKIISLCNERHVPVITATQMLESMTTRKTPTRAEVSDVANAIWDGSDALMLSGETAAGKHPEKVLEMMAEIVVEAERRPKPRPFLRDMDLSGVNASLMAAASMVAEKVGAKKILSLTESGSSCRKISLLRPRSDVLGITVNLETARKMCLYWGVTPWYVKEQEGDNFNFSFDILKRIKGQLDLKNGDKLVVTRGDGKYFLRDASNSIKVEVFHGNSGSLLESATDEKKKILLDTSVCAGCRMCVRICPHDIWEATDVTRIAKDKIAACTLDMECVSVCPTGAIEIIPLS